MGSFGVPVEQAAAKGEHGVPTLASLGAPHSTSARMPAPIMYHDAGHPPPPRPTAARFYGIGDMWSGRPVRHEAEPHTGSHPASELLLNLRLIGARP
jgi:hypothetical protein